MNDENESNNENITNNNNSNNNDPNIIVLSNAGKPIYTRYNNNEEDDEKITIACGCIQALIATTAFIDNNNNIDGGGGSNNDSDGCISSINANNLKIVFLIIDSIILVAISDSDNNETSVIYLKLQLEYIYLQIIFTLTKQVLQNIFKNNPSFDLRRLLGNNNDTIMNNILNKMNNNNDTYEPSCFLTSGIKIVSPISYKLREEVSSILISNIQLLQDNHNNTDNNNDSSILYVFMLIQNKYFITIVQPKIKQYYLYSSDLHLLLNFIHSQNQHASNTTTNANNNQEESANWFPLCLPRFNSSGYVYAYTCTLHESTDLNLVVICANNSPEQFQLLRTFTLNVQIDLGISSSIDIEQQHHYGQNDKIRNNNAIMTQEEQNKSSYNKDNDENTATTSTTALEEFEEEQKQQQESTKVHETIIDKNTHSSSPLLKSIKYAMSKDKQQLLCNNYSNIAMALHFLFRFDVCVNPTNSVINSPSNMDNSSGGGTNNIGNNYAGTTSANNNSTLTQCYSPPLGFPFISTKSKQHLWNIYQRLALRLRLGGSSSIESSTSSSSNMLSYQQFPDTTNDDDTATTSGILQDDDHNGCYVDNNDNDGVQKECYAINLLESPPAVHGVTYLIDGTELYIGLNGAFFELYAVLPATISPKHGCQACTKLVRKLMADSKKMFILNPPTFRL